MGGRGQDKTGLSIPPALSKIDLSSFEISDNSGIRQALGGARQPSTGEEEHDCDRSGQVM
jgi:hypothetical protein